MTSKATMDLMDQIHLLTAEKFADILKNGVKVINREGETEYVDPSPAFLASATKFLKDNDITVDPGSNRLNHLEDALKDVPDFDEFADHEQFAYRN